MTKYIYILPHKVKKNLEKTEHIEILTQKTTLVLNAGETSDQILKILEIDECISLEDARKLLGSTINTTYLEKIISFMEKHQLIYLIDHIINSETQNFINYLAQYTNNYKPYLDKMMNITFRIFSESERLDYIESVFDDFGLNNSIINFNEIENLTENEILIIAKNSTDLTIIEKISEIVESKNNLWMFVLFYEDAFFLSPVLNQQNFTDFYSLKNQIDLEELSNRNISYNRLVQNMGVNEMILELLISIMKLRVQTTYDKALVYESNKKDLSVEKIYYYPELKQKNKSGLVVQRWEGEVV